jgi:hypothetical protein
VGKRKIHISCQVLMNGHSWELFSNTELLLALPTGACNTLPVDCSSTSVDWWLNVRVGDAHTWVVDEQRISHHVM